MSCFPHLPTSLGRSCLRADRSFFLMWPLAVSSAPTSSQAWGFSRISFLFNYNSYIFPRISFPIFFCSHFILGRSISLALFSRSAAVLNSQGKNRFTFLITWIFIICLRWTKWSSSTKKWMQDNLLPSANVSRIMKKALPENSLVANEAKELMRVKIVNSQTRNVLLNLFHLFALKVDYYTIS